MNSHHEKILHGIISDLMKVPFDKHEDGGPMDDDSEPKGAHIEVISAGKAPDPDSIEDEWGGDIGDKKHSASHKVQMKKIHSMKK